jgi:hypothetical protein
MPDKYLSAFLAQQHIEGKALENESDILRLFPLDEPLPTRYLVQLNCRGLVRRESGEITEADSCQAGVWFAPQHLYHVDPFQVVTWLGPMNAYHPNIAYGGPFVCLGHLGPGTPLADLIFGLFEIWTYQKVTLTEKQSLCPAACSWARQHRDRWPVDRRALKRRKLRLEVERL